MSSIKKAVKLMEEAVELIERIRKGNSQGGTYPFLHLEYPRENICIINHVVDEDSFPSDRKFDILYLVWRNKYGELEVKELANSVDIQKTLYVDKVWEKNQCLMIEVSENGGYQKTVEIPLSKLNFAKEYEEWNEENLQ